MSLYTHSPTETWSKRKRKGKIVNIIYQIIAWALPTASVDKAVAAITKAAATLAAVEAAQNAKAVKLADQAAALNGKASEATAEAERAGRVAAKLADLTA